MNKLKNKLLKFKQNFIDYWFGYVGITKNYIHCIDKKKRLESFDIWVGRYRKGNLFSGVGTENIDTLINQIQNNDTKYFNLYLDLGCGAYQNHTFNKYQQKLLLEQLKELMKEEFYFEEDS